MNSEKQCEHESMLSYSEENRHETLSTCRRCGAKIPGPEIPKSEIKHDEKCELIAGFISCDCEQRSLLSSGVLPEWAIETAAKIIDRIGTEFPGIGYKIASRQYVIAQMVYNGYIENKQRSEI